MKCAWISCIEMFQEMILYIAYKIKFSFNSKK